MGFFIPSNFTSAVASLPSPQQNYSYLQVI